MEKLLAKLKHVLPHALSSVILAGIAFSLFLNVKLANDFRGLDKRLVSLQEVQSNLDEKLPSELFEDHLKAIENISLRSELTNLQKELETLKNIKETSEAAQINESYTLYADYQKKLSRNSNLKLNIEEAANAVTTWGGLLLGKKFDDLKASITEKVKLLDTDYQKYLATLPPPVAASGGGYSYLTVNTEKGSFGMYLIKIPKSQVTVKTVAAIEDDCSNDCATKTLQQYVSENNAFAGITGSYSCPADYSQCSNKKWSFDFALYDSNDRKWLNEDARSWSETGMMTFSGRSTRFYEDSSDYDGDSVSAAISNYPSLLEDGDIKVDSGDTDSYQETKGLRGAIGTDDNNIYLAYVTGASVTDTAYAMRAVGAKNALNLDGGGTAAMYINGGYVVGPGRPLANAILLIK